MDCMVPNENSEVLCSAVVTNMVIPKAQLTGGKKQETESSAQERKPK